MKFLFFPRTPLHCAASCNNLPMVKFLVEHGACIFATTISDHETAAEKCEEDEDGYDGCSEYLYSKYISDEFNPYVTNELSHPYHLDESTFVIRGIRSEFSFLCHFSMEFQQANRIASDGTPHFAASHLGLFCCLCPIKRRQAHMG